MPYTRPTVSRRSVIAAAAAAGLPPAGGAAAPGRPVVLRLPAPSGPHPVGATVLYLVDRSRPDPLTPGIPVREVMVTVWYPAGPVRGRIRARQMTPGAAALFAEIDVRVHRLPSAGVDWAATRAHAYVDAPALAGRRPVLLYSPGGGDPRTLGTGLAEDLASHGYVVAAVDHPGDAGEVEFPVAAPGRERVRPTVLTGEPGPELFTVLADTRIADLRFVLDRLADAAAGRSPEALGRPLPRGLGAALDLRRVGAYGHSLGGTAVTEALRADRRIRAGVNLEGYLDHPPAADGRPGELFPVAREGTDRPLLLAGTDGFRNQRFERSWPAVLARSGGRARRRLLHGAGHWVFTDYAALAPRLQAAGLMPARDRDALVGPAGPERSVPAVRGLVRSFFGRYLPPCGREAADRAARGA
ncbi:MULTISPECIES: alpha/beta hydrolase family protein [Streptomyces]|uniref:alpha/beta hydrolase family protein n=1 Tax=Streptomyces TaxID=1883 RepID=UPI00163C9F1B|nr:MULTISPECIES: alpha/beta hydrolase [Streptomyces]MBC2876204.1 alpha/beta hydrolase [Streptomyces sp. TYQ1024]UBI35570.1 alpha/beta hydrolase [Streptomyces mobaraensis]UKW28165.1 alpha/beta hydrolase [Streptomyces sp. TYQ1024]